MSIQTIDPKEHPYSEAVAFHCSICGRDYGGVAFARSLAELNSAKRQATKDEKGRIRRDHPGCIARKFGRPR